VMSLKILMEMSQQLANVNRQLGKLNQLPEIVSGIIIEDLNMTMESLENRTRRYQGAFAQSSASAFISREHRKENVESGQRS
ncbi:hypothetical protein BGZ58_008391, partial [Dissophora ornata]